MAAATGAPWDNAGVLQVSISEAVAEGRGVCGTAFRSRQACVNNDFLENPQNGAFAQVIQNDGARSGAAFPLSIDGRPVRVMLFISAGTNTFPAEFAELLQRL